MADNVFTGKNGTLTLSSDSTPEGNDAGSVLGAYNNNTTTGVAIARVTNVEVFVQTGLEEFHEIGARHAVSLHPGDIHIHGKIGRAYVNGELLALLLGKAAFSPKPKEGTFAEPVFQLKLDLSDPAITPAPSGGSAPVLCELVVDGVKLQNWVQSIPEEGFVMENVTFKALKVTVTDTGIKPTFK